ncbi:uncharacterized protein EAF01_010837 [Botrytis porri]|uniref:DNA (cytosine-5-)-methyltransferase n=1 Tax=Botrytis porri TaxID=87229 RepID=A0A4Z1KPD3_9HELO|nr:uncharacterized protein EAF01_010837 [Botrytis porri]KAF7889344.1 hypothetical protein EAF01_010837 [Botrytis porri]TGO86182.1 hypothetical protein BPOR_0326g00050 [Botrytis porri]
MGCTTMERGELFMTFKCANISKSEIRVKIRVNFCGKGDDTNDTNDSANELIEEEYNRSADRYFYRSRYDPLLQSFSEAKEIATQREEFLFEECESCTFDRVRCQENQQPLRVLKWNKKQNSATGFIYKGTIYQLKDFIYFISKPTSGSKVSHPYGIGRIQDIRVNCLKGRPSVKLTVDNYERYDDHFQPKRLEEIEINTLFAIHENRRVFQWNSKVLNPKDLDGHCFVRHIEQIENLNIHRDLDGTFWVQEFIPNDLGMDAITVENLKPMPKQRLTYSKGNDRKLEREFKQEMNKINGMKLNALEIFSGAGGSSQGLHESGMIGTSYAIESDTAACETFSRNFPEAIVYNTNAGEFLERAMRIDAGLFQGIVHGKNGKIMPRMPLKGEIDMIVGGSPCQGSSRANRQNNPKKILKNPICPMRESIATFLSFVEFYGPKYCLLENVTGLKHHPLNGTNIPNYSLDKGLLKSGGIKFIFRVFTSLGYQCRYATLQAGAYGVPSSRRRVIFWASLPGYKLLKFPEPTNVFKCVPKDPSYPRRLAPHRPLTIQDCISDLPPWEFTSPHQEIQQTPQQEYRQIDRGKTIAQYPILKDQRYVGLNKQAYASKPSSEYQRDRRKFGRSQLLHNHVTSRISVKQAERVCNVPLEANADYRRMNGRHHPKLHRTYTVRELARTMGFPDSFIWDLETTKVCDALKQIGNAVPVPFGRALGNGLWKVLQERDNSRESEDDEAIVDQEFYAIDDEADQDLDMSEEILAGNETDSDEDIDDLVTAQLEKRFNQSTDDQTDAESEDEDEEISDTDEEVSDDSDLDIDADKEDQEDLQSDDEHEENWNTDKEISNESEIQVDEGSEDQEGQEILEIHDESEQDLDTDEEMSGSDVDVVEDMEDQEDLASADEEYMIENVDLDEEFLVNVRILREQRINTGGSRDDAIVIEDSE